MAGAERIVAIDVGKGGKGFRIGGFALFFAGIESNVFQDQDIACCERGDFGLRIGTDGIAGKRDRFTQQLGKTHGRRMEGELRFWTFAFWTPEVTHEDQFATAIDHRLDRGERHADASIVGDRA